MHFFLSFLSLCSFHRKQNKGITNYFSLFVTYFFFSFFDLLNVSSLVFNGIFIFGLIQNNLLWFQIKSSMYPDQMLILKNCLCFFRHFVQRISKTFISLTSDSCFIMVYLLFHICSSHNKNLSSRLDFLYEKRQKLKG